MKTFLVCILLLPTTCFAQICGKVVKVADGDTFTLLAAGNRQVKIRLHGIDAPEKKQAYGTQAKEYLAAQIAGQTICIDSTGRDRYGRVIAIVRLNGDTLNKMIIASGYAWHYKKYDHRKGWAALETTARASRKGLWNSADTVAPWVWRKQGK